MSASKPSAHAGWARPALLLGAVLGALALLLHNTDLREAAAALPVQLACGRRESDTLLIPRRPAVRLQMVVHRPAPLSPAQQRKFFVEIHPLLLIHLMQAL